MNQTKTTTVEQLKKEMLPLIKTKIAQARKEKGLTQVELAKLISVSDKTISAIETGRVEPSISQMQALANALQLPVGYFTGEKSGSIEVKFKMLANQFEEIKQTLKS